MNKKTIITAYHESSHAIVSELFDNRIRFITIDKTVIRRECRSKDRKYTSGLCAYTRRSLAGFNNFEVAYSYRFHKARAFFEILQFLAGMTFTTQVLTLESAKRGTHKAGSDFESASRVLDGWFPEKQYPNILQIIRSSMEYILLNPSVQKTIHETAFELLSKKTLSGDDVRVILNRNIPKRLRGLRKLPRWYEINKNPAVMMKWVCNKFQGYPEAK